MEEVYAAMIRREDKMYLVSSDKGTVLCSKTLDGALESMRYMQHNVKIIKTNIGQIVGRLLDENMIIEDVKNYGLEMHAILCKNTKDAKQIYDNGIKPYTIRDCARDIIKELSRGYLIKPEL